MRVPSLALAAGVLAGTLTQGSAETVRVAIDKFAFAPERAAARVGDTVEWINREPFAHTATLVGRWDVAIPPGGAATLTLTEAGEFDYACRLHPNMRATLVVAPPASGALKP